MDRLTTAATQVYYPESDGKPMGETEDLGTKQVVYAMLGVQEYFLYDPLGECLRPSLQGYQLQEGEYQRIPPEGEERLISQSLGLELQVEEGRLRLISPTTGERLLTPAEALMAR